MVFLISFVSALTGSMGNARMVLRPEVNFPETTTIDKYILVNNVNDVPINISVFEANDEKNIIEVIDSGFILQPGESKEARFKISLGWGGTYSEQINVLFSPMEGAGAGVALTSTVIVYADGMTKTRGLFYVVGLLLVGGLMLFIVKKRGFKNGDKTNQ